MNMNVIHRKGIGKLLLGITLSASLLLGGSLVTAPVADSYALTQSESVTAWKNHIFDRTNEYRVKGKLGKLSVSPHLNKVAQDWANTMAKTGNYKHNPNVEKLTRQTKGWTWAGGENIAMGQKDGNAVSAAWYKSPGHKANIMFKNYNRIGIGVAFSKSGKPYYVQVFGYNTGADKPISYKPLPNDPKAPFADVRSNDPYLKPISWMKSSGLSTGSKTVSGMMFYPKDHLSVRDFSVFSYRLSKPKGYTPPKKSPFNDLKTTDSQYRELSWMKSSGMTSSTSIGVNSLMTRESTAVYLYRLAGPASKKFVAPKTSPYSDIKTNNAFYKEITWARSVGLFSGTSFGPKNTVTRDVAASIFYKFSTLKK